MQTRGNVAGVKKKHTKHDPKALSKITDMRDKFNFIETEKHV